MRVGPEDAAVHRVHGLQHVMMVVPVDPEEHEAHDVAQEHGDQRSQRADVGSVRRTHLEDHDRDDDGDHAVAERFHPGLGQPVVGRGSWNTDSFVTRVYIGPPRRPIASIAVESTRNPFKSPSAIWKYTTSPIT